MKDLTKHYIDLSKCSEDEKENIKNLIGYLPENKDCVLMFYDGEWDATTPYHTRNLWLRGKTELLYPEFIKLFEGEEEKKINMTFGITAKNMEIINKQISRFEGAEFDRLSWEKIAKEIGWDLPTIILWYFRKKESQNKWIKP